MVKDVISLSSGYLFKYPYASQERIKDHYRKNTQKNNTISRFQLFLTTLKSNSLNLTLSVLHKLTFSLIILITIGSYSQQNQENTNKNSQNYKVTNQYMKFYKELVQSQNNLIQNKTDFQSSMGLPVILHIIRKSNGETDYNLEEFLARIPQGFANINKYLIPINSRFYLAEIRYIDSDELYNKTFNIEDYTTFVNTNSTNFFIINNGENFASKPNATLAPNTISFSKDVFGTTESALKATVAHEIGHYFGLIDTNTNTEYGNDHELAENVARGGPQLNCEDTGDLLCSTPADPYGSSDDKDKFGATYFPDKTNLMSNYTNERSELTDEQYLVMNNGLQHRLNDFSNRINAYIPQQIIEAPMITSIKNESLQNNFSWTNVENNLGYIIERSSVSEISGFVPIIGLAKDVNSYIDSNVEPNTNYWYRIIAINSPNNYSISTKVYVGNSYCTLKNTCDSDKGYVPTKILLSNGLSNLITHEDINCQDNTSLLDSSNITLTSDAQFTLTVNQSTTDTLYYNLFIDFNMDGDFNDANEWVIENQLSTAVSTFEKGFNLSKKIIKQGITRMRFVSSIHRNENGTYPLRNACILGQGFSQDINVNLQTPSNTDGKIYWNGSTNNDWFNSANWSNNKVPNTNADIVIPGGLNNYPTVNDPVSFNSLVIKSNASIIANATMNGNVEFNRLLHQNKWHLIASPILNESLENLISKHDLVTNTQGKLSFAYFDNNMDELWNYLSNNAKGALPVGTGYLVKLASTDDFSFKGSLNTNNVMHPIKMGVNLDVNLLGNPFAAYIKSSTFTTDNSESLSEETIWVWNGQEYEAHNAMNPVAIAPAQGFFIEAQNNEDVFFSNQNQQHKVTGVFSKHPNSFSIELNVDDGEEEKSTKIFYTEGKTKGFDNGYDSKLFSLTNPSFSIYTKFISGQDHKKLAIQTLPASDYETMIIPVGIVAEAGKEITFVANVGNLPPGINVYLEDRVNNQFIDIHEEFYTTTLEQNVNGTGRFFIHTTNQLSTPDTNYVFNDVQIYKSGDKQIKVAGIETNGKLKMYSILGKEVLYTKVSPQNNNTFKVPYLAEGIYIVKLKTEKGIGSKKIKL